MRIIIAINLIIITLATNIFSQNAPILESLQKEISELIQIAKYSVVTVAAKSSHSYFVNKDRGLFSLFKDNREEKKDNLWMIGSGVIYNEEGYIITRSSILADFEEIKVTLFDEAEFDAEYIGTDERTGLALLKIDERNLQPTLKGNSDEVSLYSLVLVLGNSMGISQFASFGLINGHTNHGRFILSVPINPGIIGGPVFNLKGEIIGIITAELNTVGSMQAPYAVDSDENGIALPINQVCQVADEIIEMHKEKKVWLGITFDTDSLNKNKLIVESVYAGSPAERAGLKAGDQLIKYNETNLPNQQVMGELIKQTKPGTNVSIGFVRKNRLLKVFPRIERQWPSGFNPHKPRNLNPIILNQNPNTSIQYPVTISPQSYQQINSRMIQMENEIQGLKNELKKYK